MSNKQITPIRAGGRAKPIMPETFEDVQRIAAMAVKSELFKKGKRDEPDDVTIARCCLAVMTGLDVGLSPAQAVQSIAVINGKCLIFGGAVPGILWAHSFDIEQTEATEANNWTATCTITRPNGKKITRSFSKADAIKARLWDERETIKKQWDGKWQDKPNDSPWFRFGPRMLGWRALGFAKTDGASDVMHGLDIRENDDHVMIDVTPAQERPSVLAVPTDIDDGLSEKPAETMAAEPEVNQDETPDPSTILQAYQTALDKALTPAAVKKATKAHQDGLQTLDEETAKVAALMEKRALDRIAGKTDSGEQGSLLAE